MQINLFLRNFYFLFLIIFIVLFSRLGLFQDNLFNITVIATEWIKPNHILESFQEPKERTYEKHSSVILEKVPWINQLLPGQSWKKGNKKVVTSIRLRDILRIFSISTCIRLTSSIAGSSGSKFF